MVSGFYHNVICFFGPSSLGKLFRQHSAHQGRKKGHKETQEGQARPAGPTKPPRDFPCCWSASPKGLGTSAATWASVSCTCSAPPTPELERQQFLLHTPPPPPATAPWPSAKSPCGPAPLGARGRLGQGSGHLSRCGGGWGHHTRPGHLPSRYATLGGKPELSGSAHYGIHATSPCPGTEAGWTPRRPGLQGASDSSQRPPL